jgi:O-antigen ligase
MSFLAKENITRWHRVAWCLCAVTLPWVDMANNTCLVILFIVWIAEGNFKVKWQNLKSSRWIWPFVAYYLVLVIGMMYTPAVGNGLFTLNKKITFLILPIMAATSTVLDEKLVRILKRGFVYSCCAIILLCLATATFYFFDGGTGINFDIRTNENFKNIHPDASAAWMHFSYIEIAHWAGWHPAYLSMYLVFCLVILFTEDFPNKKERNIHIGIACVIICFVALLATRMAIIAFICSAAYLTFKKTLEGNLSKIVAIAVISFILGFWLWVNPVAKFRVVEEPMITTYHADKTVTDWNSVSYRLLEWEGSWSVIKAHWLGGVGTGGGKKAMDNFYAHYNYSTIGLEHNAHNQYLQVWMESGLLGLLAFLLCLSTGLFRLWGNPAYVCFILIFSLMCLTESIGERQKGVVFFTLFQVLFLGIVKKKE